MVWVLTPGAMIRPTARPVRRIVVIPRKSRRRGGSRYAARTEPLEPRRLLAGVPVPVGSEFPVNMTMADTQMRPAVAAVGSDGYVVAGESFGQSGNGWDIQARRVGAGGAFQGDDFRVNGDPTLDQRRSAVAGSASGFVVAWDSVAPGGPDNDVYARLFDASGAARGGEFRVNTTLPGRQMVPAVAMAPDGRFVVAWVEDAEGSAWDVYARRFAADGSPLGNPFRVNVFTAFLQVNPSVAMGADGSFVVAWDSHAETATEFYVAARTYDADGVPAGDEFRVSADLTLDQGEPAVAVEAGGGFVVTWHAPSGADGVQVQGRRFGPDGVARGDAFPLNTHAPDDQSLAVVSAGAGGFVTAWQSLGQDGEGLGVYARPYDAAGAALAGELPGNTQTAGDQSAAAVAAAPDGGFLLAWQGPGADGSTDVFARAFSAAPTDPPAVSVSGSSAAEGGGTAAFTVTLSGARDYPVSVQYATQNGTAVAPADYAAASGTLTFAPGETSKVVSVPVVGDALDEADETFSLVLSEPVNGTVATATAAATITDDDPLPVLTVSDITVPEGGGTATFTLTLSAPSGRQIRSAYQLGGGPGDTADRFDDFNGLSALVTFEPGQTTQTVSFDIVDDALDEDDERFSVRFSAAQGTFQFSPDEDGFAVATIVDNDPLPVLTVGDVAVLEGDDPAGRLVDVPITLSASSGRTVTVNYNTVDDTATAPADYAFASGTLTFAPGETTKVIQVRVIGDTAAEPDERFWVNLWGPQNADAFDRRVTVRDDDTVPVINLELVNPGEALSEFFDDGLAFLVTLSRPSPRAVTFDLSTVDDTALAGSDYNGFHLPLTFEPGETRKELLLIPVDDNLNEAEERLFLDLSNVANATVGTGRLSVRVVDDDPLPGVRFDTPDVILAPEGDDGTTLVPVALRLVDWEDDNVARPSGRAVTVGLSATGTATAGEDFVLPASVTFAPGETSKTFNVTVVGDRLREDPGEAFTIHLSPDFARVTDFAGTRGVSIQDDDPDRFVRVSDTTATEGDGADVREAVFTLTLTSAAGAPVTVRYVTRADSAAAGSDFVATDATVTFAPGETEKTVRVPLVNDEVAEINESFALEASIVSGPASSNPFPGSATVVDDDWDGVPPPTVTGVYVASTQWKAPFKQALVAADAGSSQYGYLVPDGPAQLDELPWANLNQVSIAFSTGVTVRSEDLAVNGSNGNYDVVAFAYDPASHTATWTLDRVIGNNNVELFLGGREDSHIAGTINGLPLNGYWSNGSDTYPSGSEAFTSTFVFQVNVLPGDVNGDGAVDAADLLQVRARQSTNTATLGTAYPARYDVNGSGTVDVIDQMLVRSRYGTSLPVRLPPPAPVASASARTASRLTPPRRDLFGGVPILA